MRLQYSFSIAFFLDSVRDLTKVRLLKASLFYLVLSSSVRHIYPVLFVFEYRGTNDIPILIFLANVSDIYLQTHLSALFIFCEFIKDF